MEKTIQRSWSGWIKGPVEKATPHHIRYQKITEELEKTILELRLNNRFGPRRIGFRLKKKHGISLGTKTIYYILKKHKLNVLLSVKLKRKYTRGLRRETSQRHGSDGYQRTVLSERVERQAVFHSLYRRLLKEGSK